MKRALIGCLALLLLFSFVSCSSDGLADGEMTRIASYAEPNLPSRILQVEDAWIAVLPAGERQGESLAIGSEPASLSVFHTASEGAVIDSFDSEGNLIAWHEQGEETDSYMLYDRERKQTAQIATADDAYCPAVFLIDGKAYYLTSPPESPSTLLIRYDPQTEEHTTILDWSYDYIYAACRAETTVYLITEPSMIVIDTAKIPIPYYTDLPGTPEDILDLAVDPESKTFAMSLRNPETGEQFIARFDPEQAQTDVFYIFNENTEVVQGQLAIRNGKILFVEQNNKQSSPAKRYRMLICDTETKTVTEYRRAFSFHIGSDAVYCLAFDKKNASTQIHLNRCETAKGDTK